MRRLLLSSLFVVVLASAGFADPIAVGTLDFETVIPGDGDVGTNAFFTVNLTGNGVDFMPAPATFTNATLTLYPTVGSAIQYWISSLQSGQAFPSDMFPETTTFSSASFTGTLDGLNWTLSGLLLPVGNSTALTAGQFAVIYADADWTDPQSPESPSGPVSSVPEPATLALMSFGLAGAAMRRMRSQRQKNQG